MRHAASYSGSQFPELNDSRRAAVVAILFYEKPAATRYQLYRVARIINTVVRPGPETPIPEQRRLVIRYAGSWRRKNHSHPAEYRGKTYYFCSKADRDKFKQNPPKYVKDK